MTQNEIGVVGATRFAVGLSGTIRFSPGPQQIVATMKIFSGGGTLEIVECPPALTGSSGVLQGTGYPVGASEILQINGPAVMYFAATGATMVVAVMIGRTVGATTT
jgi:hypothetical protein